MAESTATIEGSAVMNITPGFITNTTRSSAEYGLLDHPDSPMEDTVSGDTEIANSVILTSHTHSPVHLKGAKNNIMLGATPQLSMSTGNNSLHHFQTDGNSIYTHTNSGFIHTALGPTSNSDSLSYSSSTVPSSATAAFMAMHGHNTSLYESPRRNSVPTLTADQAEHKRKISSEEKTLQRQASWSSFSSPSTAMSGFQNASLSGLHQLDGTHVDPAMMNYYRTQFSQHHPLQQSHSLNHAIPSSNNSSACPSPMPESFMPGSVLNNISSSPLDDVLPNNETGRNKVKRNNSVCSTTSMSSTGSSSNNKHPCKSPNCGWSFKRYEHLKRHLLVHSKERPFVCDFSGCDKSFSRSDNFSAHLRTHSKKGSDHRRRNSRALESNGNNDATVKQETLDHEQGSSLNILEHQNSESGFCHSSGYASGSMSQEPSESGRESSPARSPGSTRVGLSSTVKEEDRFGMVGHSGYTFGNNTLYSMDPLDSLNSMVPRFNTIRLDLKSVAPSDIHKPPYEDDSHSHVLLSAGNPNGESPHPSPMPHYEQFTFPSSISAHFMPMLHGRFSIDHTGLQQQQHQLQQSHMHDPASQNPYASLPSTETSGSSAPSLHHHLYHSEQDLRGFQFTNAVHGISSQLQYPSTPMNEDGPMHPLHSNQSFHPHGHLDFYDAKVANPQMLHHPFSSLQPPTSSALPPHPLMSNSVFSTPGLNEPLYSSSSSTPSTHSSLLGSRGKASFLEKFPYSNNITAPSYSSLYPDFHCPRSFAAVPDPNTIESIEPSVFPFMQAAVNRASPIPTETRTETANASIQYYPSTTLSYPQFPYLAALSAVSLSSPSSWSSASPPPPSSSSFLTHSSSSTAISQSSTVMDNSKRSSLSSTILPLSDLTISTPTLASQRHHPLPSMMMRVLSTSSDYSDSSLYASSSSPSFSSRYLDTHCMSSPPLPPSSSLSSLATTFSDHLPSTSSSLSSMTGVATTNSDNIAGADTSGANTPSTSGTSMGLGSGGGNNNSSSSSSSNGKHGGSGKHHTCSVMGCSKRFKRLEHLKRHIKTHTQERPFNCPYTTCSKRFSRSDNLAQHVKTHQRQINKLQMKHRSQAQAQAQAQS